MEAESAEIITTQPTTRRPKAIHFVVYFRNSPRFAGSNHPLLAASLSLALIGVSLCVNRTLHGQVRPTYSEGAGELVQKLQRLTTTAQFTVTPVADAVAGAYRISARAVAGGRDYVERMRLLAYPHIQTHRIYEPAALDVRIIDLRVEPVQVGYIMGVDDEVADALRLMGVHVTLLTPTDLESGEERRTAFDAGWPAVETSRPATKMEISRWSWRRSMRAT